MRTWSGLVAAVALLAGCGGSDQKENLVEIQGDEYAYVMPGSIEGGWTTLRLENTGKEPHEFALAKLEGKRTRADVLEVLSGPTTQEQGPPAWVTIRAGIPTLRAGETASLTQRLEAGERTLELRNDSSEPNAVFLISYKPGKPDEDLVAWEEGGMKGPAPGDFHGGAIDVPGRSSVFYTYTFETGVEYALVDDVNGIERRFTVD